MRHLFNPQPSPHLPTKIAQSPLLKRLHHSLDANLFAIEWIFGSSSHSFCYFRSDATTESFAERKHWIFLCFIAQKIIMFSWNFLFFFSSVFDLLFKSNISLFRSFYVSSPFRFLWRIMSANKRLYRRWLADCKIDSEGGQKAEKGIFMFRNCWSFFAFLVIKFNPQNLIGFVTPRWV